MIDINGERVKLDSKYKGSDELLAAFAEALTKIENHFNRYPSLRLKWAEKFENLNKATGKKEPKSGSIIRFEAEINIGMGNHIVNYYTNKRVKDGETTYLPHSEMFDGNMIFTRNDTERLAYYMVCEPRIKYGQILVENIEKDAEKLALTRSQNADLLFYLFSDASPLSEARLKVIAYNFGIDCNKFHTVELLKNRLYDAVLTEEGRRPGKAVAEFKEYVKGLSDEVKAVSFISQGVFKKIIKFDHENSQWIWTNDPENPILRIPINERSDEMGIRKRLGSYLITTKKLYLLEEALGVTDDEDLTKTPANVAFDKYTEWEKLDWVTLKRALKNAGVKYEKSAKMPELIELCKESFKDTEPQKSPE